jgi:hypothetical protein
MRRPSLLRRAVLALLLVAFPAVSTTMALGGPVADGSAAEAQTAQHGDCHGPHHPAGHHHCCDFCGAACGCSVHFGASGIQAPAPVVTISAPLAAARASRPADRVPHLLPLPLGPPLRLA